MKSHSSNNTSTPVETNRASTLFGLWLRAGFAGALLVLVGVSMLLSPTASSSLAVAVLIGGVALAATAWRRSAAALALIDGVATAAGKPVRRPGYGKLTNALHG